MSRGYTILLGSCFLVLNYDTADSKTKWIEGLIMICFYAMIAVCAWFYVGQPELPVEVTMLACPGNVAQALAEETGSEDSSADKELVARLL